MSPQTSSSSHNSSSFVPNGASAYSDLRDSNRPWEQVEAAPKGEYMEEDFDSVMASSVTSSSFDQGYGLTPSVSAALRRAAPDRRSTERSFFPLRRPRCLKHQTDQQPRRPPFHETTRSAIQLPISSETAIPRKLYADYHQPPRIIMVRVVASLEAIQPCRIIARICTRRRSFNVNHTNFKASLCRRMENMVCGSQLPNPIIFQLR